MWTIIVFENAGEYFFGWGGSSLVQTGRIRPASVKEVLAKLVGDSASFLQFSGDSEESFLTEVHPWCMVEFL